MYRTSSLLLIYLTIVVLLAGCGEDDGDIVYRIEDEVNASGEITDAQIDILSTLIYNGIDLNGSSIIEVIRSGKSLII